MAVSSQLLSIPSTVSAWPIQPVHCAHFRKRVPSTPSPINKPVRDLSAARPAVILTRPSKASGRSASRLVALLGDRAEVIVSPLVRIEFAAALPDLRRYDGVIFTSENAVDAFAHHGVPPGMAALCVGRRTADAAGIAGFQAVSANGSADGLAELVASEPRARPLLYARGQHVAFDLPGRLRDVGVPVDDHVVYAQRELTLDRVASAALESRRCICPLFSEMAARILGSQAESLPDLGHSVHCISRKVADAFHLPWRECVAEAPDAELVLASAAEDAAGKGISAADIAPRLDPARRGRHRQEC